MKDEKDEGYDDLHVVEGVAKEEQPVVLDLILQGVGGER